MVRVVYNFARVQLKLFNFSSVLTETMVVPLIAAHALWSTNEPCILPIAFVLSLSVGNGIESKRFVLNIH